MLLLQRLDHNFHLLEISLLVPFFNVSRRTSKINF
jgi:hypothetical protein